MEERAFRIAADGGSLAAMMITPCAQAEDAPTLLFLHEGLGSIGQWRDFPRELAGRTGLRTVAFDRPGFGASDPLGKPRDGRHLQREDLDSLTAVLEGCGIDAPILVGQSDGATLALLYAAAFPERPLGVIVEAAHVFVEELTLAGIRDAERSFNGGKLRDGLARYHGEQTESMFRRWTDDWLSPEFARWNVEERLAAITAPLLVIQGEDDPYGTPAQVESICQRVSGPVQSLLIPGCGHAPHLQAREEVLQAMCGFIGELPVRTGCSGQAAAAR